MKCKDIILHDFVIMLTESDYSFLSSDPVIGREMFEELYDEYNSLVNSPAHGYLLSILQELAGLKSRYVASEASLMVLQNEFDQEIVDILAGFGYGFDQEHYAKSLDTIRRKLKSTRLNIERKEKEYQEAVKKNQGKQQGYQDFVKMLAVLSQSMGFYLNIKTITVADFAAYYDSHMTKIKANARPDR